MNINATLAELIPMFTLVFMSAGGGMNPARKCGPALVDGDLSYFWMY